MKKVILAIAIVMLGASSMASAEEAASPDLLKNITVTHLPAESAKEIRGEWFYTWSSRNTFCKNNPSKCDSKLYDSKREFKYGARDERRFRFDKVRSY